MDWKALKSQVQKRTSQISSPFKNLADFTSVQQSLLNPDTEWDI